MGDSLSAGYGLSADKSWVNLLDARLGLQKPAIQLINLSVSGDTSSNGLTKLPMALARYKPDIVMIELGANDGLRGLSLEAMKGNIQSMVDLSQAAGADVLLLATPLPPNYGQKFITSFEQVYQTIAQDKQIILVASFLEGVAGHQALMQKDGLHPNEQAQKMLLANVWVYLKPLLERRANKM